MITLPPIVYCSCVDWNGNWERMHQLAYQFAAQTPLLFVDNPGVRSLRWEHIPRIATRLAQRLAPGDTQRLRHAERLRPTMSLLAPLLIPSPTDAFGLALNRRLLRRQVVGALRRREFTQALLWTSTPVDAMVGLLDAYPWAGVVYDCVDDLPALHPSRGQLLQRGENCLLQRADLVFVTSHHLADKLASLGRTDTIYVPNGIDPARFDRPHEPPACLARLPHPIIGFVGSFLPGVFDLELTLSLARQHPEWSIVLAGPLPPEWQKRANAVKIVTPGAIAYDAVPAWMRGFDVGIIPFCESPATRAINPLKTYEYLACGLPVVSTPLPELDLFAGHIRQASGVSAFAAAVADCLRHPGDPVLRAELARQHSWDARLTTICRALDAGGLGI